MLYFCDKACDMKLRYFLVLSFILFASACENLNRRQMELAEALLNERPDSSLAIMNGIEPASLKSRRDKAYYALLMSAALDKNYIDIASDSLTRQAVDYYSTQRNKRYRMLAWYYHGLVLMNAMSYSSSIVALERAEKDATALHDDFYSGLILRNKAKVFNMTNNNPEAIACQRRAVEHYEKAGKDSYKSFAEVDLAIHYTNNKDYDMADSLFSAIRRNNDNPVIIRHCNLRQAGILVETEKNPEDALFFYRKVPRAYYGFIDCAYLALAHERLNHRDSADYWMSEGYRRAKNQPDSATLDYMKSRVELDRGCFQTAFHLVNHATAVQDSLTRVLLQQSVSSAQRDYFKSASLLREEKTRSMRARSLFGTVLGILLVSMLMLGAVSRSRKKDSQLQEQMAQLALKERELERITQENAHLVGSLFSEKIDHLDKLAESYFRLESGKEKELAFMQIKQLVATIRNDDDLFSSLEKDLDRYCDNIMSKLREQVPRIKGENLRTIMLFFAGYSYETVQLILNKVSIESLRMARSRFRKEIKEADAADADVFLSMLEMK